jgi:uncharacterized coiled-coil protein SlyX
MKLNEFKEMMDTDAQKRVVAQEKTIKELHKVIADQQNKIEILEARLGRKEGRA